jgi:energy-converting hydrogenase A subunit M
MNYDLKTDDVLDIRNCILTRIMWIEDHILPVMKEVNNTELVDLYIKEIASLNEIHNKLTLF